jgi:hypothetical protein
MAGQQALKAKWSTVKAISKKASILNLLDKTCTKPAATVNGEVKAGRWMMMKLLDISWERASGA